MAKTVEVRPLLVAIHGAVANAATWLPVQRCLGADVEVRAVDLAGHGTRRAQDFDFGRAIDELVAEVTASATHRRVFVAGDSLGGYLALAVAAAAGPAVAGVIAGSCTYPMRGLPAVLARASLVGDAVTAEWPFIALARLVSSPDVSAAIVARGLCSGAMSGLMSARSMRRSSSSTAPSTSRSHSTPRPSPAPRGVARIVSLRAPVMASL
jgi:alpha-beta hydrolase superfamily lysophospholipase